MSTGKLKNVKFKVSHFWGEKRPTKKSEDRIPTMLGPATPQIECAIQDIRHKHILNQNLAKSRLCMTHFLDTQSF